MSKITRKDKVTTERTEIIEDKPTKNSKSEPKVIDKSTHITNNYQIQNHENKKDKKGKIPPWLKT